MMLTALKVIFLFLMVTVNLLCILLPLKYGSSKEAEGRAAVLLALASSLTTGVFLGTCYVQLVPLVEVKFMTLFKELNIDKDHYQELAVTVAQCAILLGFFLIMFIEQGVHIYQHKHEKRKAATTIYRGIPEIPDGYMASSDESDTNIAETEDSKRVMLPKKKKKTKSTPSNHSQHSPSSSYKGKLQKSSSPAKISSHPISPIDGPPPAASGTHVKSNAHCHGHLVDVLEQNHGLRCVMLIMALSAHTLFEGIAIGLQDDPSNLISLFLGVLVHECFIAFAVGISLAKQSIKRQTCVILAVLFSLSVPTGMAIGMALGEVDGLAATISSAVLQAIAAGTFVYVIFLETLPPEIYATDKKLIRLIFLLFGFGIIVSLQFGLKMDHHV